jgi:hypothetical protein
MRLPVLLVCTLVLVTASLRAQRGGIPTDTLAEVGTSVITARDFLERLELMPFPGKDHPSQHDSAKVLALRALVAERLLAQEAAVRGLNRDSASERRRNALERLMVRDELYKREVTNKVQVTDRELSAGMHRYPFELRLLYFSARSGALAHELHDSLAGHASIDTALHRLSPRLLRRGDTLTVKLGSQDWTLEDTAFALTPKRRLSQAVKTDFFGWGVLYLLEQRSNPDAATKSIPDRIEAVRSSVRQRKMDERSARFQGQVLSPHKAVVDSTRFDAIVDLLFSRIRSEASARAGKGGYRLIAPDLDSVEVAFAQQLNDDLVHIPGGGMSLRDMLDALRSRDIAFPVLELNAVRARLNGTFKDLVAAELLAREGYRQNIQHTDAVRHDVGVWNNYWDAAALVRVIRDSVTVDHADILKFLSEQGAQLGASYEVNVREILCDSMGTALEMLRRIVAGDSMSALARTYSRRKGWAERSGESGFFAVDVYPSLGIPALFQDSGSVGGPLRLQEGYSVFTTLGKRTSQPDGRLHLDSLVIAGSAGARAMKQQESIESAIGDLVRRAGVRLNLEKLARTKVTANNMFTRRFIGFGGVITAVPTILPLWQWKGEQRDSIVP